MSKPEWTPIRQKRRAETFILPVQGVRISLSGFISLDNFEKWLSGLRSSIAGLSIAKPDLINPAELEFVTHESALGFLHPWHAYLIA